MATYLHTTLLQFRSALIKALDSDITVSNFWPNSELDKIIQQALLTFGGLSGFFKTDIQIATEDAKRVYDIFKDATPITAPTITYGDIINWLNIDLIENISVSAPTSNLFTLDELLGLIDSKYNVFQLETNLVLSVKEYNVVAQNNLVKLSDETLDLVRLRYSYSVDGTDYEVILQREDEENISYFDPEAITEEGIPLYYSTVYSSPNEIKLYPIPNLTGTLEVIFAGTRDLTQPLTVDTVVNMPSNLTPYLKYHALQDIYNKDGVLNDASRAAYCAKRVNEGVIIGKNYSSILTAKSNGIPIDTDSLNKVDAYTDILSPTNDAPTVIGLAGFNIFEINTLPNTTVNSVLFSIIKDANLPANDDDFIDVEKAYIDPIMNYCVHLAQFKCGSYSITLTEEYLQDFIQTSLSFNKRLSNRGVTYEMLLGRTKLQEKQLPRLTETQQPQQQQARTQQ